MYIIIQIGSYKYMTLFIGRTVRIL